MGVDYTANYGFGVKIIRNEEEDFLDWLDEKLEDTEGIAYFEVGDECYSGNENEIYVCINVEDEIAKQNRYEFLSGAADELMEILTEKGIEFEGVPNIVGGLNIW